MITRDRDRDRVGEKEVLYEPVPGTPTHLSREEEIAAEGEWHSVFAERMSNSGWSLKHEVVCNHGRERCDFLAYHDELNTEYDSGRWVGFELKYSDGSSTRALEIASQIEDKYAGESFTSSGKDVDFWVVAPYVENSHSGTRSEMIEARAREMEAAKILTRAGYGYLISWHPTPYIMVQWRHGRALCPRITRHHSTPGIPAFKNAYDPWKNTRVRGYESEMWSEVCRLKQSDDIFTHDRRKLSEIRTEYRMGEREPGDVRGVLRDD